MREALDELQPDAICLEAAADVAPVLALAGHAELRPPVAMLVYPPDAPRQGLVFPLALFSPEWQAIRWGLEHSVPVTPMDLPVSLQLSNDSLTRSTSRSDEDDPQETPEPPRWRTDPIALLAEAAGYQDHELWWEEVVERRQNATGLFAAILDAMRAVREESPESLERDLVREAFMRKTIRQVQKSGAQKIAVICGAWHAPVLDEVAVSGKRPGCRIKEDNDRLKSLSKTKTVATWIPWTHARLAYRSGYGAGVESPGWYSHLWDAPDDAPTRWIVEAARLLRGQGLSGPTASLIEVRRLAETLAAIRERRTAGLQELNESLQTILCQGEPAPMKLIRRQLELGDRIGSVPPETPSVPLDRDVQQLQKSLRLKPAVLAKRIDLDLRTEIGREKSRFLHRLNLLEIPWGIPTGEASDTSTFHEYWTLEWKPEFAISVIEANVWGNTVLEAATARAVDRSLKTGVLQELTQLLDLVLLSDLPDAIPVVMRQVQTSAAIATDVVHLMDAFPPLVRIHRYGDVRQTAVQDLEPVLVGIIERTVAGLPGACVSVDDEAAQHLVQAMSRVQSALSLFNRAELQDDWHLALRKLTESSVQGLLRGWCCRCLLEQGLIDAEELDRLTRRALSRSVDPADAANWVTGLLQGSGLLLIHQTAVWQVLDVWLSDLGEEAFVATLPLLRRAFSEFSPAERRQMGRLVRTLTPGSDVVSSSAGKDVPRLNERRAALVLPVLAQILGVTLDD